uniref:Uncharacterized protein n=1 Tax=Candidatus Kentrum sp. SD TaxID=2126332 RepID=A0A451BK76_9GAMM|nr:MAG: hypothetical protein BECKSD772F_GA0070984_11476 [Candidatus Kentron sp. SD]VFK45058.1 MAG: hypothetical protein BECKSD772E_GA0070983_104716 [Candidatus Kentron sp. SD]VFK78694.1 MAG: hypothetical protein BECKSD772D_GA0070982_102215 [Candidatus Kentron sp. SD]
MLAQKDFTLFESWREALIYFPLSFTVANEKSQAHKFVSSRPSTQAGNRT